MKFIIFGTGETAAKILSYPLRYGNSIVAVYDNNQEKWGGDILSYKISPPPAKVNGLDYDFVILAIINGMWKVKEQLITMGVPENKIILSLGWSGLDYYSDPLDLIFDIPKKKILSLS